MKKSKKVKIKNKHGSNQPSPNTGIENPRGRKVEFVFPAPEGKEVYLTGEFNGWDPQSLPMVRDEEGTWKAEMELLPGRYEFKPLMDGAWIEDVPCRVMIAATSFKLILALEKAFNPFGTHNFAFWVK